MVEDRLKGRTYSHFWWFLICMVLGTAVSCTPETPPTPAPIEPVTTARVTATTVFEPTMTMEAKGTASITQTPNQTSTPSTTITASPITPTHTERKQHTIDPIAEFSGPLYDVQWSADGKLLIYALSVTQWPYHVRFLPVYQNWWQYNVESGSNQPLPPPQTRVTDAVRQSLGVCPFSSPESASYPCLTTLHESPISNRIAYSSIASGTTENTWLANIDGSDSIYLEKIGRAPEDVMWSSNGQWLLIGHYYTVDNSNRYYLVSSDGTFVENLEELTSTSHYRVQGPKPAFSPDGQKLAFVGRETGGERLPVEQLDLEEAYNIYVIDLNTMEWELVSPRFGLLQWSRDGSGLYVLDGAANSVGHLIDYILDVQYADFYYIDLTDETYPEQKLAGDIPIYFPYNCGWAYSPEANAMAECFAVEGYTFGILFLEE
jgi:hypothetical protein